MSEDPPSPQAPSLGEYAIHRAWEGFASILHRPSGEIMHSRTEPTVEAERVYVEQSGLRERLLMEPLDRPLVLWDVGLGAAANALAAIRWWEAAATQGRIRPLEVVSFENDLDSLRLAVAHPEAFPYIQHPGPGAILTEARWNPSGGIRWRLLTGDFLARLADAADRPEVIFYDMYSSKTCPSAWRLSTFRRLRERCAGGETSLCTYTRSTAARAGMLAAGFWVARGGAMGAKEETTIALTEEAARGRSDLLGLEWLARWERSTARFPADVRPDEENALKSLVVQHPQFA